MRRLTTFQLVPGMVIARDIYSYSNQLILPEDFVLTDSAITKLEFYTIPYVYIKTQEDKLPPSKQSVNEQSLSTRVKQSQQFQRFSTEFQEDVVHFKTVLNDVVEKNAPLDVDIILQETLALLDNSQGSFHIFDMLHNLRHFDDLTYTHGLNVGLICNVLATWLNFSPKEVELTTLCGLFHDIGKLKIPEEIIKKPSRLTDEEYKIIKKHPLEGYNILQRCQVNPHVARAALMHHERCDGGGYPLNLSSEKIDKYAKVVAIADVYDAMTSARIYRGALCPFEVIRIFENEGLQKYETKYILTFLQNIVHTYISHNVRLSDGRVGKIIFVNTLALSRPLLQSGDTYIDLSKEPYDVSIVEIL